MASRSHRPRLGAVSSRSSGAGWLLRLRLGILLGAAALIGELVYVACASPRFAVREVRLRGDPAVVEQAAARIELAANTSIFRAPMRLLEEQVEATPAVRRADVSRDFPSLLVVAVERREPVAVIRRDESPLLVDAEGVVFSIRDEWGWGLPELVGPHLTESGVRTQAAASEIAALLAVLRAFWPEPRLRMTRLTFGGDTDIEASLCSGPAVQLGGTDELGAKVALLAETIEQLGAERIEHVNLGDPRTAYWRPRADTLTAQAR